MIYLRYDVCFADDIRLAYEENEYYIILAVSKYIMRQSRISYCESNISLKNATFNDKIYSKEEELISAMEEMRDKPLKSASTAKGWNLISSAKQISSVEHGFYRERSKRFY